MEVKVQIIIAVILIITLGILVNMVRKRKLELRYTLVWLVMGCGILILDCFPRLMDVLAELIGIASPVNMLFFLGFLFSLSVIFSLTTAVSKMSIQIREMSQELALYKKKMEK